MVLLSDSLGRYLEWFRICRKRLQHLLCECQVVGFLHKFGSRCSLQGHAQHPTLLLRFVARSSKCYQSVAKGNNLYCKRATVRLSCDRCPIPDVSAVNNQIGAVSQKCAIYLGGTHNTLRPELSVGAIPETQLPKLTHPPNKIVPHAGQCQSLVIRPPEFV